MGTKRNVSTKEVKQGHTLCLSVQVVIVWL